MKKLTGAITALATPFKRDGSIDVEALRKLVKFQLSEGINGLVPCGSTGEAATMNSEEYQLVVKTVVEEVRGRVPVIAGAGSNDTLKAVHFSLLAKQAGANALLHVTPYYNKPTINGLIAHYKAIAKAVDLPIVVYNVPGRTGLNLTSDMTLKIANAVDHIIGVKEASGNLGQMMEIVKKAPSNFSVLSGDDLFTLPLLSVGGHGCISVVSNEVPRDFAKLIQYGLNGDFAKAKVLHYKLMELMNANFIETNPLPVKTALSLMGKIEEVFRLPLVPMEEKNKLVLKDILKRMELI
ncbi:MAG: 4-hydroxy-tetrahydrodipicolinate synthase [Candidatus Levybacteria bacterium]|nr:4-hydroxy-tetrahydrodipicolinate synthase [Candidatus Levybacteria bacterium]